MYWNLEDNDTLIFLADLVYPLWVCVFFSFNLLGFSPTSEVKNQSTERTGGSTVSECRLGK